VSSILANGREVLARGEYTLRLHGMAEPADEIPVVVVHPALGSYAGLCRGLLCSLPDSIAARGCRVLGFDLAGHGLSDPLAEFPEDFYERAADDLVAVLDAFGVARAGAAVGIGSGGIVALLAAARAPDRIACVVADSPPGVIPSVPYEPWDEADGTRPDGYDAMPAWLRFVDEQLRRPVAVPHPDVPLLVLAHGGRLGRSAPAPGGWPVTWAPCVEAPVSRHAPEFFVRELERFLAAHA
jgi:pimeloyl-ACP methyl ester carboxylesterase